METCGLTADIKQAIDELKECARARPDGTVWVEQPFQILTHGLHLDTKQATALIRELVKLNLIEAYYPWFKARLLTSQCAKAGIELGVLARANVEAARKEPSGNVLPAAKIDRSEAKKVLSAPPVPDRVKHSDKHGRGRKLLPQSEVDKIIAAYDEFGGNVSVAARALERSPITVSKYWKQAGLVSKGKGGSTKSFPQNEIDRAATAHSEYAGNAAESSEAQENTDKIEQTLSQEPPKPASTETGSRPKQQARASSESSTFLDAILEGKPEKGKLRVTKFQLNCARRLELIKRNNKDIAGALYEFLPAATSGDYVSLAAGGGVVMLVGKGGRLGEFLLFDGEKADISMFTDMALDFARDKKTRKKWKNDIERTLKAA